MKTYLVQYGRFNKGLVLEAKNEQSAVEQVVNGDLFYREDFKFHFKVFELKNGQEFKADYDYTIKKV